MATHDGQHTNKQVVIAAVQLVVCAWNSAPIDDTKVIRSVCAVGREFYFPFDFEYVTTPSLNSNNVAAVHEYLALAGGHGRFAPEILRLLLEEKRMISREKINEGRHVVCYKIDDLVTVRVQAQSNASKNMVVKLLYKSKGPFVVR
jgi:hypothetical protein